MVLFCLTEYHCIALAALDLVIWTRLTWNLERPMASVSLLGVKVSHKAQQSQYFLRKECVVSHDFMIYTSEFFLFFIITT